MNETELRAFIDAMHRDWDAKADDLIQSYETAAEAVSKRLTIELREYSTKGKLDNSASIQTKALKTTTDVVNSILRKGEMKTAIDNYIKEVRSIFDYTKELQSQLNGENLLVDRFKGELQQLEFYFDNVLRGAASVGALTEPLKQQVLGAVVRQESLTQLENSLRLFLIGDDLKLGIYPSYASNIARDLLYQANGIINNKVAIEIGANAYRYVGSLKPGVRKKLKSGKVSKSITNESRPQCRRWVTMGVLPFDIMTSEIRWAVKNGSGMIPGTITQNFGIYRGGYNCRHEAIPFLAASK